MPADDPAPVMAFPDLDTAESAIDWLGLEAVEGGDRTTGWFEGELDEDDAARLDAAWSDADTPQAVRALAGVIRERLREDTSTRTWRVTFPS